MRALVPAGLRSPGRGWRWAWVPGGSGPGRLWLRVSSASWEVVELGGRCRACGRGGRTRFATSHGLREPRMTGLLQDLSPRCPLQELG